MATLIGIGISTKLDSFIAGREAAVDASSKLGTKKPDLLIVFISTIFDQREVIKGVRSISITEITTPLIGCSTAASISNLGSFRHAVTVNAISSDSIKFSTGLGKWVSKNPRSAGNKAARQASQSKDIKREAYIMFSDSMSKNTSDLLRGTQEILGTTFPVIGGIATDNLQFKNTYQYLNEDIYTNSVVGLLIGGNLNVSIGKAHGWKPIGRPHKITKATSNIVKEIDRKKAVGLYEKYLGKSSLELKRGGIARLGSSYPLGVQLNEKGEYLTRSPLSVSDNGSLSLAAEIPEQKEITLMFSDKNLILDATRKACTEALENTRKSLVKFAVIFSDIGRLLLLRKDFQSEIEIIKDALGLEIPFFGCYTCGEYAPFDMGVEEHVRHCYYHNQAITVAIFSEKN